MKQIFEKALLSLAQQLAENKQTWLYDPNKNKAAVIVEPRSRHPMLEPVIRNCMAALGPEWNLVVFTHDCEHVKSMFPGCTSKFIHIPHDSITPEQYSKIFMDSSFWNMIQEETIVIFQTDVVMFRSVPDWCLECDYAGANYYATCHVSKKIGDIQGGFSIRKKSAMLECINKVAETQVCEYLNFPHGTYLPEDVYFTIACDVLGKTVPTIEARLLIAIECDFYETTAAYHGFQHSHLNEWMSVTLLNESELFKGLCC